MAENVIFAEQTFEGFAINSFYGAYFKSIAPSPFELVEGQEYKILWDKVEYTRTAFAFTNAADSTSCIAVGNKMVSTGVSDGDLFAIVNDTTNNYTHLFSAENKTEHTVAIYQTVADEPQEEVGIVIKNYSGTPIEYKGVEKVMFNTADGGKRVYSKGEALEDVSIELDFSSGDQTVKAAEGTLVKSAVIKKPETLVAENIKSGVSIAGIDGKLSADGDKVTVALDMSDGDMVIEPTEGKLFSSVTVQKPDTLIPENIAEGVDIAGIIGTLVAGGGGSKVVMATGRVSGSISGNVKVTHNLGVIPDVIFVQAESTTTSSSYKYVRHACGISSAFRDAIGATSTGRSPVFGCCSTLQSTYECYKSSWTIEATYTLINSATDTTFYLGDSSNGYRSQGYYNWYAIGGLT